MNSFNSTKALDGVKPWIPKACMESITKVSGVDMNTQNSAADFMEMYQREFGITGAKIIKI